MKPNWIAPKIPNTIARTDCRADYRNATVKPFIATPAEQSVDAKECPGQKKAKEQEGHHPLTLAKLPMSAMVRNRTQAVNPVG
ncbi:MAG TPA: hypothetical protein VFQ33_10910 [Xanthobacteraceae bacterium]|nr:hypothetical protein [Xanthobacteraceae bacterium]